MDAAICKEDQPTGLRHLLDRPTGEPSAGVLLAFAQPFGISVQDKAETDSQ
jgi:hypothetical protein